MADQVAHRKPIIGLCGGIGAGKSRVASEFERLGCLWIDSDRLGQELLARPDVLATLREWWGEDVVTASGAPDRRRIAGFVFEQAAEKKRLEDLLYPLIAQRRRDMITAVEQSSAVTAIVIDSPLLLESHLDRECDSVIFVHAGEEERLRRLQAERGWSAAEIRRRERWQMPLDEKRARAEFVIDNDGPAERIRPQVADILAKLVQRYS